MKQLGIWHPRAVADDRDFIKQLRNEGFTGLVLMPRFDYIREQLPTAPYETLQRATANDMLDRYTVYKQMGFTIFLNFGAGWGLGKFDGNYFYQAIDKSLNLPDVINDWGEFWEDYVEQAKYPDPVTKQPRQLTREEYYSIRSERNIYYQGRLEIGGTARNKQNLGLDTLTSYWNQKKYWAPTDPFFWIYGQLSYHFPSSLRYKAKAALAKKYNTPAAFLYQGDLPGWDGTCFMIKLLSLLNLKEIFETWQRKRFIKHFGE